MSDRSSTPSRHALCIVGMLLLMVGMGVMTWATLHFFIETRGGAEALWWTLGILSAAIAGNGLFWRNA